MSKFKHEKMRAWQYYKSWMNEVTYSKALRKNIKISRQGWDHLIGRNVKDMLNRFRLLKLAKHIISKGTTFSISKVNRVEYIAIEDKALLNGKKVKIKVILKKDKKGNLIFFSVMKK